MNLDIGKQLKCIEIISLAATWFKWPFPDNAVWFLQRGTDVLHQFSVEAILG